jgi:hypothetical protein
MRQQQPVDGDRKAAAAASAASAAAAAPAAATSVAVKEEPRSCCYYLSSNHLYLSAPPCYFYLLVDDALFENIVSNTSSKKDRPEKASYNRRHKHRLGTALSAHALNPRGSAAGKLPTTILTPPGTAFSIDTSQTASIFSSGRRVWCTTPATRRADSKPC